MSGGEQKWAEKESKHTEHTNSAMNRVFDEAVARGLLAHKNVPMLVNKGEKSERRPDFTREEYATMIRKLPHWIKQGKAKAHRYAIPHAGTMC